MDLSNATPFPVGFVVGPGPDRSPALGVIIKGTFEIPDGRQPEARLAAAQMAIATTDEHYGDDVEASVRLESDLVSFKTRTDLVVVGSAHAPGHVAVPEVDVSIRVGHHERTLRVFGDRYWTWDQGLGTGPVLTRPRPFVQMPLVYERAYGGIDRTGCSWCRENLVGTGHLARGAGAEAQGTPVPNIENPRELIASAADRPAPAGFGFYGKGWQPRVDLVGSEEGMKQPDSFFGLPADFRLEFHNAAHPELQIDGYLQGWEDVEMRNLTPDGYRSFRLPGLSPVIRLWWTGSAAEGDATGGAGGGVEGHRSETSIRPVLDTLVFLPDENRFYQVWRGHVPVPDLALDRIESVEVRLDD